MKFFGCNFALYGLSMKSAAGSATCTV